MQRLIAPTGADKGRGFDLFKLRRLALNRGNGMGSIG